MQINIYTAVLFLSTFTVGIQAQACNCNNVCSGHAYAMGTDTSCTVEPTDPGSTKTCGGFVYQAWTSGSLSTVVGDADASAGLCGMGSGATVDCDASGTPTAIHVNGGNNACVAAVDSCECTVGFSTDQFAVQYCC